MKEEGDWEYYAVVTKLKEQSLLIDSIDPVDPLQKNIQLQTAFGIYSSEVDPRVKTILNGIEPREFLCMIAELSAEDIL